MAETYGIELNEQGYIVLYSEGGDPENPADVRVVLANYGIGFTDDGPLLVKLEADRGILVGCSPDDANEQVIQLGWLRLAPVNFVAGQPTALELRTVDDQVMLSLAYPAAL